MRNAAAASSTAALGTAARTSPYRTAESRGVTSSKVENRVPKRVGAALDELIEDGDGRGGIPGALGKPPGLSCGLVRAASADEGPGGDVAASSLAQECRWAGGGARPPHRRRGSGEQQIGLHSEQGAQGRGAPRASRLCEQRAEQRSLRRLRPERSAKEHEHRGVCRKQAVRPGGGGEAEHEIPPLSTAAAPGGSQLQEPLNRGVVVLRSRGIVPGRPAGDERMDAGVSPRSDSSGQQIGCGGA